MCPTRACSWRETTALGFNGSRDPACAKLWDLVEWAFDVDAAKVLGMPRDLLRPSSRDGRAGNPMPCQSSHGWYSHALLTYSSVLNSPYSHAPSFPARQGLKRTSSRCATGMRARLHAHICPRTGVRRVSVCIACLCMAYASACTCQTGRARYQVPYWDAACQ